MVTISHIVKKIVREHPVIMEALRQEIASYGALAEKLDQPVREELGKPAKHSAIMMALRRYAEELRKRKPQEKKAASLYGQEIVMKSGIADIGVAKSGTLARKLEGLYRIVDFDKGGQLNLIQGNYEVSIITNERYAPHVLKALSDEKIIVKEKDLAAISMSISKEHLYTPGSLFEAVRKLAWDNVNIFEIVSTATELTFIVSRKDALRAYNSLQELSSGHQS
ncbi:hypothetical protein HY640_04015 [Candidatus Woesearchaeota archaeon]|nr:hypothetical protein [Candidatus Woesearchaeota archaeon]